MSQSNVYIRELLSEPERENHPEALRMDRAIHKLRDEITGVQMERHRGHDRELAFVLAKLDEAAQWALTYLEKVGQVTVFDRGALLKDGTVATIETVGNAKDLEIGDHTGGKVMRRTVEGLVDV